MNAGEIVKAKLKISAASRGDLRTLRGENDFFFSSHRSLLATGNGLTGKMKLLAASSGVSSPELCFFRRKRRRIYPEKFNPRT
jgi:hypothetical protein